MLIGERNLVTDDFLPFTELPEDFLCKVKGFTGSEQSKHICIPILADNRTC